MSIRNSSNIYLSHIVRYFSRKVSIKFGMPTVVHLSEGDYSKHVSGASHLLKSGGVIALPTDTLYGLAALTQHSEALEEIYRVKQRNTLKPLAVCVAEVNDIYKWAQVTVPKKLLCELLPGPVTLIFRRTADLNKDLNPDTSLVGIRIPDNNFIRDIARECNSPIALTSANISNQKSPLQVQEFREIWSELSCVFDGGDICSSFSIKGQDISSSQSHIDFVRQGSTIINLSEKGTYKVVRQGVALAWTASILSRFNISLAEC